MTDIGVQDTVTVTVQPLSDETFAPYGTIIAMGRPGFPEVDEGRPMLKLTRLRPGERDGATIVQLATHDSYTQAYIPLKGTLVLVLAPPPEDPSVPRDQLQPDYARVAAFAVEVGEAVLIARGTWHNLCQSEGETVFISSTRKGTEGVFADGELHSGRLTPEQMAAYEKHARHIEVVDLVRPIEVRH